MKALIFYTKILTKVMLKIVRHFEMANIKQNRKSTQITRPTKLINLF